MRRTLLILASVFVLAPAAPAQARWFGAEIVDGPGPISAVGGVSIARDGRGGVAYIKREGDNPAGYVARFVDGVWRKPERLAGADGLTDIALVAGDNGRLAVVWVANGNVVGTVADGKPGNPFAAPVPLSAGGGASGLDIQIGIEGGAYAVWAQGGGGGSDVRAAHLVGTTWTALAAPLDIDPARAAGSGGGRPRVAVAADDTAVATWGEADAAGVPHVFYRRLLGNDLSQYPQEASVAGLGSEAGGAADTPQIDVEYDRSFAWVTFRQDIGGRSRTLTRRLLGSTFDPPVAIDNGLTSAAPALAMNPIGEGLMLAAGADNTVLGSLFANDIFRPTTRLNATASTAAPEPVAYFSDRGDGAVAYRTAAADGSAVVRGRALPRGKLQREAVLSRAGAGPVVAGTLRAGGDRVGDVAVAMLQGSAGAQSLTVALRDEPPARPVIAGSSRNVNARTAGLSWRAGLDYLGPQRFEVRVDGKVIGRTTRTRLRTRRVRDGRHRLQVVAIDRRGQRSASRVFTIQVHSRRR